MQQKICHEHQQTALLKGVDPGRYLRLNRQAHRMGLHHQPRHTEKDRAENQQVVDPTGSIVGVENNPSEPSAQVLHLALRRG